MNTPNNAAALLPCPFCGGAVQFRKALWPSDGNTDAIIHVAPTACGMIDFDTGRTDESVIDEWNRRATLAQPDALTSQPSGEAVGSGEQHLPPKPWTDEQCVEFMCTALRHVEYRRGTSGPTCDDIRLGQRKAAMLTHPSADAPGVAVDESLIDELVWLAETPFNAECCNASFPISALRRICKAAADALSPAKENGRE